MDFSVNTNLAALNAYNALAKANSLSAKAQFRLATSKKINSVADDTSGYNVGKKLESQTLAQKAQLSNVSSAKNYLATAETSLQQINDKLNQISAKYVDSRDALKDQASIAKDIRTLAGEIDSILKNTNINGRNLLAQSDGTALASNDTFNVGGEDFSVDFASETYLNAEALKIALHGGTTSDPGVASYVGGQTTIWVGSTPAGDIVVNSGAQQTSTIAVTFADGSSGSFNVTLDSGATMWDTIAATTSASGASGLVYVGGAWVGGVGNATVDTANGKNITSFTTTSGIDITTLFDITRTSSGGVATSGLLNADDATVLSEASDISPITNNVKSSLGRIGNLSQTLDSRNEYLTSALANNSATISNIFDADLAAEQLNATKYSIAGQLSTSILAQLNSAPQQLLSLFK